MKSTYEELNEIQKTIDEHTGAKAHILWDNHVLLYRSIYLANRDELINHIIKPSKDDGLLVELMQNIREPIVKTAYMNELLRLLHNYLSSSFTLVDHSRRLIKKYSDKDFSKHCREKIKIINDSGVHHLLQDTRNYFIHYSIPPIGLKIGLNMSTPNTFEVFLSREKLLIWDGITSSTKDYLQDEDSTLDLLQLMKIDGNKVDDLNNWMHSQFFELHSTDIAQVNRLIESRNNILKGNL